PQIANRKSQIANLKSQIANRKSKIKNLPMPRLFSKVTHPWYPATAIGLEKGVASVVHLERGRGNSSILRGAATISLGESLIQPSFAAPNIAVPAQLAKALREL